MRTWSLLPTLSADMPFQMAFDEKLFRQQIFNKSTQEVSPVLRFYVSSEPWTSVGYSHPLPGQLTSDQQALPGQLTSDQQALPGQLTSDQQALPGQLTSDQQALPGQLTSGRQALGTQSHICRRITGGGQVHHGNDLIFSLIARKEDDESFKSVRVSYWKIHEAVKSGLEALGQKVRFYRCDEDLPRGGECFIYPISSDLEVKNQKVAGGAQKRSMGVFLHQESIQLEKIGLKNFELHETIALFVKGFEQVFDIKLEPTYLDPEDVVEARKLAVEKYMSVIAVKMGI